MNIKSMTACFGRLDRQQLELRNGLNIIHAPNEGGKSTWCAFIRAMFYGVPTRDRDKKGYLAEKNRYQPWSGAPMEGEMTLTWQGRDITLRRFTKGATPFGGFSAVYTDTQQPVPGLTAQNCGETLLGVGREVWERSAFIGSAPTLAIDGTPELERRIAALFSSGEEEVSFSQTEARLREWQRRRQHNRSGLIPRLEEELAQADRTLEQMQAANRRLAQALEQRPALEEQLQELEGEVHIHQRLAQRELNGRYAQALQQRDQVRAQLDELQARQSRFGPLPLRPQLEQAQGTLQYLRVLEEELRKAEQTAEQAQLHWQQAQTQAADPRFPGLTGEQALLRAQEASTAARSLLARAQNLQKQQPLLFLPGLAAGCALTLAGWLMKGTLFPFLWCGLGLFGAVGIVLHFLSERGIRRCRQEAQHILDRYDARTPQDIPAGAEDYRRRQEAALQAEQEVRRLQDSLVRHQARLEEDRAGLMDFVHSFSPGAVSLSDCSAALSGALELEARLRECRDRLELTQRRCDDLHAQGAQEMDTLELLHTPEHTPEQTGQLLARTRAALAELDRQEAMAKGELLTLGDRAGLEARRDQLCAQLERRRTEYEALSLALDGLRQANAALQARFAPELNRRSGQILSALTAGRYSAMTLDREFDASAQSSDSLLPRSTLALSRGTADQIYLAVRLAVCQLCLPGEDPSPLVLDDALLTFDDTRMALALDYLSKAGRQVLLFSCQQREGQQGLGHIQSLQS